MAVTVTNVRPDSGSKSKRSELVARLFDMDQSSAVLVCQYANLDPEEVLYGDPVECPECGDQSMDADGHCTNCS